MTNLTTFCAAATALRVMQQQGREARDIGTMAAHFGSQLDLIQVGDSHGLDAARGVYDWWPLTISGETVGELRDDAAGLTVHIPAQA